MTRGIRRCVLLGCAGAALALSGCTEEHRPAEPVPVARASASAEPTHKAWEDPEKALSDAKVWASSGRRTGSWEARLPKARGGTVWVATQCQGTGTLTVDASRYGTLTEHCSEHPDGSLNAFEMTNTAAGRVRVTPGPGVTWAVAVGWSASRVQPEN
ncbi:hypothetical protein ABZ883_34060 [Streptomyces sp. NPDC046977]|uniref:hypothetical protein n=1 Tax=Streptomyces sp. NPDC046977 TaxID=3154703 RepID=UPI0033E7717E